jgi:hypothetical protein
MFIYKLTIIKKTDRSQQKKRELEEIQENKAFNQ